MHGAPGTAYSLLAALCSDRWWYLEDHVVQGIKLGWINMQGKLHVFPLFLAFVSLCFTLFKIKNPSLEDMYLIFYVPVLGASEASNGR